MPARVHIKRGATGALRILFMRHRHAEMLLRSAPGGTGIPPCKFWCQRRVLSYSRQCDRLSCQRLHSAPKCVPQQMRLMFVMGRLLLRFEGLRGGLVLTAFWLCRLRQGACLLHCYVWAPRGKGPRLCSHGVAGGAGSFHHLVATFYFHLLHDSVKVILDGKFREI